MEWTGKSIAIIIGMVLLLLLMMSGIGGLFLGIGILETGYHIEKLSSEWKSRKAFPPAFQSLCAKNHLDKHTFYGRSGTDYAPPFAAMLMTLDAHPLDEADPRSENVLACLSDSARVAALPYKRLAGEERRKALGALLDAADLYYPLSGQRNEQGRRIADSILRGSVIHTYHDGFMTIYSTWQNTVAPDRERAAALLEALADAAPDRHQSFAFYNAALQITQESELAARLFAKGKALLETPGAIFKEPKDAELWLVNVQSELSR